MFVGMYELYFALSNAVIRPPMRILMRLVWTRIRRLPTPSLRPVASLRGGNDILAPPSKLTRIKLLFFHQVD